MSKISSVFTHLRNGTLLHRIQNSRQAKVHRVWQRFLDSGAEFIDMPTFGNAVLRLYKNFGSSQKIFVYDAEKEEVEFVYNYLNEGDVFLDIGAHIGYFSVSAAGKVGPSGEVHGFEPTPRTYEKLKENVEVNQLNNVTINQIGLSEVPGKLVLNAHPTNEAYNTIGEIEAEGVQSVEIETKRLDDYAQEKNIVGKVEFIKIDVEGWETYVFKGAKEVLSAKKAPVIMLEFSYDNQLAAGSSVNELSSLLASYGYSIYDFDESSKKFSKFELTDTYRLSLNLFAIKDIEYAQNRVERPIDA